MCSYIDMLISVCACVCVLVCICVCVYVWRWGGVSLLFLPAAMNPGWSSPFQFFLLLHIRQAVPGFLQSKFLFIPLLSSLAFCLEHSLFLLFGGSSPFLVVCDPCFNDVESLIIVVS